MGTYYYLVDKNSEGGYTPVFEDDYVSAIFSVAKERGLKITSKMILEELEKRSQRQKEVNPVKIKTPKQK